MGSSLTYFPGFPKIVENIGQMHKSTFSFGNEFDEVINLVTWHKELFLDSNSSYKFSQKISNKLIDSVKRGSSLSF